MGLLKDTLMYIHGLEELVKTMLEIAITLCLNLDQTKCVYEVMPFNGTSQSMCNVIAMAELPQITEAYPRYTIKDFKCRLHGMEANL